MPAFVARSAGTIINIASVVGISPEALNGVYGASKAARRAISQRFGNSVPAPRYGIGVPASALSHMNENRKVED